MRRTGFALALLTLILTGPAAAEPTPSFDCAGARSPTEKAICADPTLAWFDQQLSRLYGDVRQLQSEGQRAGLRDQQRAWIGQRNACGGQAPCIIRLSWQRLQALSGLVSTRGLTGSYHYAESYATGELGLVEFPGNRVAGFIETINNSSTHQCSVDMTDLTVTGQTLSWVDPGPADGDGPCRVDITVGSGGAVVAAQNCRNWCGMSGIFAGRYQRDRTGR
ncbi:MAG: lysozyme inhibitor LprI family protein [Rhodospirillaceae bacterium]